jgi:DNA repair protein RAD50
MPPNTKGASFLFDPKLIDEVETKGRIKLFFKDMSGLNVQVQKNMSCTQKMKKLEFRTLETIISRYDNQSKLLSTITSKCINADAEVINALGVSKAVLEHVIFCHQEDSNWPLSDGKLLKTRFDEIFSATKYIKALDVIKKVRLEKTHQVKQLEIERKHLESYKVRSDELHRNLEDFTNKYDALVTKKEDIKEKLKPVQKQLDYFMQEIGRIFEIKTELDKIENEKNLLENQIKELLISIKDCQFIGEDDELREYIRNFSQTTNKMRREEEEATNEKIAQLSGQLRQLSQAKSKLTVEWGVMENKLNTYAERKKQLTETALKICKLANLDEKEMYSARNPADIDPEIFGEKLNEFIDEYLMQTKSMEDDFKSADGKHQLKVDLEREVKSKLDQSIQNKQEAIKKFRKLLEQISDELKSAENDKLQSELSTKIVETESAIAKETRQLVDLKQVKEEIAEFESERSDLKQKVWFYFAYEMVVSFQIITGFLF